MARTPATRRWMATAVTIPALMLGMGTGPLVAQEEEEANHTAPAAPTAAPDPLAQLLQQAEAAALAGKHAEQIAKLTALLELSKDKPDYPRELIYMKLGEAQLRAGKAAEAKATFDEWAKKFPASQYPSLRDLSTGTAALAMGGEEMLELAADSLTKAADDPAFRVEASLFLGKTSIARGDVEGGARIFRDAMAMHLRAPRDSAVALEMIPVLAEAGGTDALVAYLDDLMDEPGVQDSLAWCSLQMMATGDALAAKERWDSALAIFRRVPPRARILESQTAPLEAERKVLKRLESYQWAAALLGAGVLFDVRIRIAQAEDQVKRTESSIAVIEGMKEFDAAMLMRRGHCLHNLQRWQEAAVCFATIREKFPEAPDAEAAAYTEILVHNELLDHDRVVALAEAFMANYPQAAHLDAIAMLLGEVLVDRADWPRVQGFYEDLLKRFPKSAYTERFRLFEAQAVFQQGDHKKAALMFQKFLKDFPGAPRAVRDAAYYWISMGYFLSNHYKEVRLWNHEYQKEVSRHIAVRYFLPDRFEEALCRVREYRRGK